MPTYMMLKVDFQNLSKIEIFRKSKDFGLILTWIIIMFPWWCIWCWKQHSITVAAFQQNCCFSETNVDFLGFCTFIQVKIEIWMKNNICCRKTTLLLKISNNDIMLYCTSFIASGPSENLAYSLLNFLTRVFGRFLGDLLKKFIFHFLNKIINIFWSIL